MQASSLIHRHHLPLPHIPGSPSRRRPSFRAALRDGGPSLAVVGATAAAGREFPRVLSERDFAYRSIRLLAGSRSAGRLLIFEGWEYEIEEVAPESFDGVEIALFRIDPGVPLPLVIPEVNADAMEYISLRTGGVREGALIANPNCSTSICLMAVTPLQRRAKVVRMVVSTYQATSGAGAHAMEELELQTREYAFKLFAHHNAPVLSNGYYEEEMKLVKETRKIWDDSDVKVTATCIRVPVMRAHAESINLQFEKPLDEVVRMEVSTYQAASGAGAAPKEELELQTRLVLDGKPPTSKIFKQQYAFNLFSHHNAPVLSNRYNEEMKLVKETRKIWDGLDVKVTATCIRVPVMRAHAESINLQFEKPLDEDTARQILKEPARVVIIDDRSYSFCNYWAMNLFTLMIFCCCMAHGKCGGPTKKASNMGKTFWRKMKSLIFWWLSTSIKKFLKI